MCTGVEIALLATAVAGSVVTYTQTKSAGKAQKKAADARAAGLEHQAEQARLVAGQERAAAQRKAFEQQRNKRLILSNAQANAAAGGGAGDSSVENLFGDLEEEGEFHAAYALYAGEEAARDLENQASLKVFEAGESRRAGTTAKNLANASAASGLLSDIGEIGFKAYDSGGFKSKPNSYSSKNSSWSASKGYHAPKGPVPHGYF